MSDTCSDEYLVPFYFLWLSVFNSLKAGLVFQFYISFFLSVLAVWKAGLYLSIVIDWNDMFLHTANRTFYFFILCDCLCFNSTKARLVNCCFPPVMLLYIPSRTIFVLLYFLWLSVLVIPFKFVAFLWWPVLIIQK